jgi:hypothetical protein
VHQAQVTAGAVHEVPMADWLIRPMSKSPSQSPSRLRSSTTAGGYFSSKEEMIVAIAEENIGQVISVLRASATGPHRSSPGAALANVLDLIRTRHIDNGTASNRRTISACPCCAAKDRAR